MGRVFKTVELQVEAPDKPGTLAKITTPIAEAKINLNACCAYRYESEKKAFFHLLTDNNDKATEALKKAGYKVKVTDVVIVETKNEAGSLNKAAHQLSEAGVDLDYCYATAGNTGNTWIVLATKQIEKALNVIS